MPTYALDAFAVLALFENEPGGPTVRSLVDRAARGQEELYLTVVNLGEVLYRLEHNHGQQHAGAALTVIQQWPVEIVSINQDMAVAAARVKAERRMGYLDCFVVALAQRLDAAVLTGDPDFQRVDGLVKIEWLER
jgi:ribonuclease VapC